MCFKWIDYRGRDGGTNYILRIKEQETRLNVHEHDNDDDDYGWEFLLMISNHAKKSALWFGTPSLFLNFCLKVAKINFCFWQ